jgi:hypothetical protein
MLMLFSFWLFYSLSVWNGYIYICRCWRLIIESASRLRSVYTQLIDLNYVGFDSIDRSLVSNYLKGREKKELVHSPI